MNRVIAARGIRLVSRKIEVLLLSKGRDQAPDCHYLLGGLASAGGMDSPLSILSLSAAANCRRRRDLPQIAGAAGAVARKTTARLTGHSKMSKNGRAAGAALRIRYRGLLPFRRAPAEVAMQRQDGFFCLAGLYQERYAKGRQMTAEAAERISDLEFTETYRVPFQYSRLVREHLFVQRLRGRPRPASPSPMSTATFPMT